MLQCCGHDFIDSGNFSKVTFASLLHVCWRYLVQVVGGLMGGLIATFDGSVIHLCGLTYYCMATQPKGQCRNNFTLKAGRANMFTTDLWIFNCTQVSCVPVSSFCEFKLVVFRWVEAFPCLENGQNLPTHSFQLQTCAWIKAFQTFYCNDRSPASDLLHFLAA